MPQFEAIDARQIVAQRILSAGPNPDARLFTGPRGRRISTAVLSAATHWDDVVTKLGSTSTYAATTSGAPDWPG